MPRQSKPLPPETPTNPVDDAQSYELRSFGRRRGRSLTARQQALLADALPPVALDLASPATKPLPGLFSGDVQEVWLEIGFGGAEHLCWQAQHHPDVGLIGCEVFEDGVIKALSAIEEHGLANIRIWADDARPLLRWLPEGALSRVFLLFPDPWPKRRHAKRRLVSPAFLDLLARAIAPAGELRIGTDIGDYARTVLLATQVHPAFAWQAEGPRDWRERSSDWPQTRYEAKAGRQGRRCYFFRFRRQGRP